MTCSTPSMINGSIYYFALVVAVIGGDDDDAVINDAHSKCLLHLIPLFTYCRHASSNAKPTTFLFLHRKQFAKIKVSDLLLNICNKFL